MMWNYQPACKHPIDASISNGAGYRLCCNPEHNNDPQNSRLGFFRPVWHKITEWKENK